MEVLNTYKAPAKKKKSPVKCIPFLRDAQKEIEIIFNAIKAVGFSSSIVDPEKEWQWFFIAALSFTLLFYFLKLGVMGFLYALIIPAFLALIKAVSHWESSVLMIRLDSGSPLRPE